MGKSTYLKNLRLESGYKVAKVAEALCISRTTLYTIEIGKRNLSILEAKAIAELYGVLLQEVKTNCDIRPL